jgi:uncharacterized protein (DUF1501 family)
MPILTTFLTKEIAMHTRRQFFGFAAKGGIAAASSPLWLNAISSKAFAQATSSYKAVVVITLNGGNDGNNMLIPIGSNEYQAYASIRPSIAISRGSCIPLTVTGSENAYGLHPSLVNIASLYNKGIAAIVANIGPLLVPVTKAQLAQNLALMPEAMLSHPAGIAQWESATALQLPPTGWGGRIADMIASQSGSLSPILNLGPASIFTVGSSVQAIEVQSGGSSLTPLPDALQASILAIAQSDATSSNKIVQQCAQLRVQSAAQQAIITQSLNSGGTIATSFPSTQLGQALMTVAQLISGRSVVGASRQLFYTQQAGYDSHLQQAGIQAGLLSDLDGAVGAFMQAIAALGLSDSVLVCTHSDFNRTFVANGSAGTDHAWGNHQFVLGGGIQGGRIIGTVPPIELGGSADVGTSGTWIPTLAVTQLTAGIGSWMGLSSGQLASVFPDLKKFPSGLIRL